MKFAIDIIMSIVIKTWVQHSCTSKPASCNSKFAYQMVLSVLY